MHKPFAKTFDSPTFGQLVFMSQTDDENAPEIRVFAHPEGLGVCSVATSFLDNDDGYAARDLAFGSATLEKAEIAVAVLFEMARGMLENGATA